VCECQITSLSSSEAGRYPTGGLGENLLQTDESKNVGLDLESQWRPSGLASRKSMPFPRQKSRSITATFRKKSVAASGQKCRMYNIVNRLTTIKNASNAKRDPCQLGSQRGDDMDLMFTAMVPDISLFASK
jgi:hypothetical protein